MVLLVAFAITLFVGVLLSDLARRSVLSISVVFLLAGFLLGFEVFGVHINADPAMLQTWAEITLFAVLFTDGMRTGGLRELRRSWHLPGRALLFGMPLTIAGIAVLAHWLVGLHWTAAFLIAAALSPTDPVFVAAIFRVEAVPQSVKHLLNVESGLNDGLALPVVMLLLPFVTGRGEGVLVILEELALGVLLGVVIPWVGVRLEQTRFFGAAGIFQPLHAFAIGLLVLAIGLITHANLFLAAFAGGVTIASMSGDTREEFERFGELISELLKLSALMLLGALIAPQFFQLLPLSHYAFVVLATFALRPLAVGLALIGSGLHWRESLTAGWFGPKGFASVVYGLIIFNSPAPNTNQIAHLIALSIAASIVIFSSTDILVGRWFQKHVERGGPPPAELPSP